MKRWALLVVLVVCVGLSRAWAAASVMLRVDTQSPFASSLQKLVAVPDYLLLSDGTVFYSRPAAQVGQIEFYTAQISTDEISTVISRLQLGGAADWDESYESATMKDLPTTVFNLQAPSLQKTISVYGAAYSSRLKQLPAALSWLYDYVSDYHSNQEKLFTPQRATLYVKHVLGSAKDRNTDRMTIKWTPRIDLEKTTGIAAEFRTIELQANDARDAWNALHGVALPTMLAPKVVFQYKKDLYQLAIRPDVPGL